MTLREALLRGRKRPRSPGAGSPTTYRGDGYEFVELRGYVAGDDVRRIDWAATARAGELQTRVVLEDVALTIAAILDDSASMSVGRHRPLLAAAREALAAWFELLLADDRGLRVGPNVLAPSRAERGRVTGHAAQLPLDVPFGLRSSLQTALAALPRGTALLVISDWHDLDTDDCGSLLRTLGARFDCTALVARDPWYAGLPLRGFSRLRGAEGGGLFAFVGQRERTRYHRAVREREDRIFTTLTQARWRTGLLDESDGAIALEKTFALGPVHRGRRLIAP